MREEGVSVRMWFCQYLQSGCSRHGYVLLAHRHAYSTTLIMAPTNAVNESNLGKTGEKKKQQKRGSNSKTLQCILDQYLLSTAIASKNCSAAAGLKPVYYRHYIERPASLYISSVRASLLLYRAYQQSTTILSVVYYYIERPASLL
jgi:hypothetical protein